MRIYRDIVIMGQCNLKCLYCGGFEYKVDVNHTIQSLESILSKFDPNKSCFRVEMRGEITLYLEIIKYLEKKTEENYVIEILSNGLFLDKVLDKESKLRSVISIDGHTEKMNTMRNLKQEQINKILDNIFTYNAEIQCVYFRQTIEQMNEFITYLKERDFKRRLHIFPCFLKGEMVTKNLDYDKLVKADFLAPKEYFGRWNFIKKNHKRNFQCDYFLNGYSYYINNDGISMVKCDGSLAANELFHSFGEEKKYEDFPCNICINHNEYNNVRELLKD